jgi:SAM-dependent methyltransferase
MNVELLEYLACPGCGGEAPFDVEISAQHADGEIEEGVLTCPACDAQYPVTGGIPRFVDQADDYCDNFGFQWQQWREIQIDRLSDHHLSETRFLSDTGWDPEWIRGKLILDGGCGAGRFADIAASLGARVVACDLSAAIDACSETTSGHEGRVNCVQASLFELPFRKDLFDGIYCLGVIQHTPDPERVVRELAGCVKPGGRIAVNFYEEGLWRRLQIVKYALRLVTPRLKIDTTLRLSRLLVAMLFPLTAFLSKIPKLRILNHFIPIAAVHAPELTREQQYQWTLLDTFDWYSPRYELRQKYRRISQVLEASGMIRLDASPGIVRGIKAGKK